MLYKFDSLFIIAGQTIISPRIVSPESIFRLIGNDSILHSPDFLRYVLFNSAISFFFASFIVTIEFLFLRKDVLAHLNIL